MNNLTNPKWWGAALTRALKTFSQSLVALIGTSVVFSAVDWKMVLSASALSALLSLLTSIAGLPEVTEK